MPGALETLGAFPPFASSNLKRIWKEQGYDALFEGTTDWRSGVVRDPPARCGLALHPVNPGRQAYAISSRTRRAVRAFDTDANVIVPAEKAADTSARYTDEVSSADSHSLPADWPGNI